MTRTILALLTVTLLTAGAALAGDTASSANTWVSSDGGTFVVHGDHAFTDGDVDVTEVDLSDLRDGETRTFPGGDGEIAATRNGDVVTISGPGVRPEASGRAGTLLCDVSDSDCALSIVTLGEGHTMVMLNTGRSIAVDAIGDGADARVVIEKIVGGGPGFRVGHDGRVELRCPEGDTTMTVAPDRADEAFLCPEHSVPLERSATRHRTVVVTVDGAEAPREH